MNLISIPTYPVDLKLNDSCTQGYASFGTYVSTKYLYKLYTFGMNEKPNIVLDQNTQKATLEYNNKIKTDNNNLIVVYNSESNAFGTMSLGQVRFIFVFTNKSVLKFYIR